jgi:glycosyltransferase involved in cell wall biosynthesis
MSVDHPFNVANNAAVSGRSPLSRRTPVTVVLFVASSPENWLLAVRSVLRQTDLRVVVGVLYPVHGAHFERLNDGGLNDGPGGGPGSGPEHTTGDRVSWRPVGSVSELIDTTYADTRGHIIVIDDAVTLPPQPFATALQWLDDDIRISTVSFLGNSSGALSFPVRNLPVGRPPNGHDEATITALLRSVVPTAQPAPVIYAQPPVVLLSASALGAVGRFVAPASARFDVAVADFSCRARSKGFVDVGDTSTFITCSEDTAIWPVDRTMTSDDHGWLLHRHRWLIGFEDQQRHSGDSPLSAAFQVARVKAQGLRVLVDGSCFGPNETGTQVATREVIASLMKQSDVASVSVALPGPIPSYAREVLSDVRVDARNVGSNLAAFGPVDVAYRPFQPNDQFDLASWRAVAPRFVVSILDVIAYANGSYFASGDDWLRYRSMIESTVAAADAITVISADVKGQMALHGLGPDPTRIVPMPLGTDHLRADVSSVMPESLRLRGWAARPFAACLGVNYGHKNREIAIDAHRILRERGIDLALVLAGPAVPYGTTRLAESERLERFAPDDVAVLPELPEDGRNWLLRHADLIWYPTSAEGFGLVPFEAAVFGTPTVAVGFGPLTELLGGTTWPGGQTLPSGPLQQGADDADAPWPRFAGDWSPTALADLADLLVRDPSARASHVAAVSHAGRALRWDAHGAALATLFRTVLARPRPGR